MKGLLIALALVSNFAQAGSFDGVKLNCLKSSTEVMKEYPELDLITVCRNRADTSKEEYMYCDGSGCSGFVQTFKNNKCELSQWWDGQDDQDYIDPIEWKKSCLVKDDFKK